MLLLLLLAAASAARGGSYSVGASLTGLGYYYSDFPRQNFTFFDYAILPAFDTSLGTLERVRYELASDFDTQASIYDDFSTQPMEVTGRYTYSIFPSVDILIGSNHLGLGVSRSGVLTEVHAPYPIDPYFFFQATPPRATAFAATTDPSLLALFGSGPYSVELGGGVSLGAELNGQPARTWQAGATAEVRISVAYDYQPVPEPASLADGQQRRSSRSAEDGVFLYQRKAGRPQPISLNEGLEPEKPQGNDALRAAIDPRFVRPAVVARDHRLRFRIVLADARILTGALSARLAV